MILLLPRPQVRQDVTLKMFELSSHYDPKFYLAPYNDKHLISPYSIFAKSNIKVTN